MQAKQLPQSRQMGLEDFSTGDGPRTYKRGGRRDPQKNSTQSSYENSAYNGVMHIPSEMEVPDLAKELRLEVHKVQRLVESDGDVVYICTTGGKRVATSIKAMVYADAIRFQGSDWGEDLDDLVQYIIDHDEMCETIHVSEEPEEETPKEQKAQEDQDQSGLGAFMS